MGLVSTYVINNVFVLMKFIPQLWTFESATHNQKGWIGVANCMSLDDTSVKSQFKIAKRWPVKKKENENK